MKNPAIRWIAGFSFCKRLKENENKGNCTVGLYVGLRFWRVKVQRFPYISLIFCFEIPTIYEDIAGNRLNLTIGGVRAYNHENLYSKKGVEKFKVFIGFKNLVCCNMCVATDGYKSELKVMNVADLLREAVLLFQSYNIGNHLQMMSALQNSFMSESAFA